MKAHFLLLSTVAGILTAVSCSEEAAAPAPHISLDSESGIYTTKTGREIIIAPSYENAEGAGFSWVTENGDEICDGPVLTFAEEEKGRYYITLTVTGKGGSDRAEIRIDVLDLTPPLIDLPGADKGFTILLGTSLELVPNVSSPLETSFSWTVDGTEVSDEPTYTFHGETAGDYLLRIETSNEDGNDSLDFTISVKSPEEVNFSWTFEQTEYNMSAGRSIRLRILDILNDFNATYTWSVNGSRMQQGSSTEYIFHGEKEGIYEIRVRMDNEYLTAEQVLNVNVCPAEGKYYRNGTAGNSVSAVTVFEYLPAPGQFINENCTVQTMEDACTYAMDRMEQGAYVSLGGFGGSITVGFDHSIDNDGSYNIAVTGNAFEGSSEPGIVWVMQDENGDGLPNDTWYELKGSEYGKAGTDQDYAVTYYRPAGPGMSVTWTDNRGNTGIIEYLGAFHRQDYYYPEWVGEDSYTLRGTCLQARNYDASGNGTYWVNDSYEWGYADNFSSIDRLTEDDNYNAAPSDNHFRISDAVSFDGQPANLKYVDFIKIQVGVNARSGWLGELSTEVFAVKDYNMSK